MNGTFQLCHLKITDMSTDTAVRQEIRSPSKRRQKKKHFREARAHLLRRIWVSGVLVMLLAALVAPLKVKVSKYKPQTNTAGNEASSDKEPSPSTQNFNEHPQINSTG